MKLNPLDIRSQAWEKLLSHYKPILAKHRARLENPDIEERERIGLAWQIKVIKGLIAHGDLDAKNVAGAGD